MGEQAIPSSSWYSSSSEDSSSSWGSYISQPEMLDFYTSFQCDSEENVMEERQEHGFPSESMEQSRRSDNRPDESGDLPSQGIGLHCEAGASTSSGHCGSKQKDVSNEAQELGVAIDSAECSERADKGPVEMVSLPQGIGLHCEASASTSSGHCGSKEKDVSDEAQELDVAIDVPEYSRRADKRPMEKVYLPHERIRPSGEVGVAEVARVGRGFRPLTIGTRDADEDQVEAVIRAQKQKENQQIDDALLAEGKLRSDMELTEKEIERQLMETSRAEHLALNKFTPLFILGDSATSGAEDGQRLGSSLDNSLSVDEAQFEAIIKALEGEPDNVLLTEEKLNSDVDLTEKEIERQVLEASLAEYREQVLQKDTTRSGAGSSSTEAGLSRTDGLEDLDVSQTIESESVRKLLSMGFNYMLVIEAYTIFGEDADSMLTYILESNGSGN